MQTLQTATRNIYQAKTGPRWLAAKSCEHSIWKTKLNVLSVNSAAFSYHDTPYKQITTKTLSGVISQFAHTITQV